MRFPFKTSYNQDIRLFRDRVDVFSPPFRFVWPSELDLMARLAGMTFRERWGGWKREPFTGDSDKHVSVWENSAVEAPRT